METHHPVSSTISSAQSRYTHGEANRSPELAYLFSYIMFDKRALSVFGFISRSSSILYMFTLNLRLHIGSCHKYILREQRRSIKSIEQKHAWKEKEGVQLRDGLHIRTKTSQAQKDLVADTEHLLEVHRHGLRLHTQPRIAVPHQSRTHRQKMNTIALSVPTSFRTPPLTKRSRRNLCPPWR